MNKPHAVEQRNLEALDTARASGSGIAMGLNQLGDTALQVFWLTEEAEELSDQVLVHVPQGNLIKANKYTPPSGGTPVYISVEGAAMRTVLNTHFVANGNHLDTIMEGIGNRSPFPKSLRGSTYEPYEPTFQIPKPAVSSKENVKPAYTPLIAAYLVTYGGLEVKGFAEYHFYTVGRDRDSGEAVPAYFSDVSVDKPNGVGRYVQAPVGNGLPPASAENPPSAIVLGESVNDTAEMFWANLNPDNRVGIVVKGVHLATRSVQYRIINAYEEQLAQGVK